MLFGCYLVADDRPEPGLSSGCNMPNAVVDHRSSTSLRVPDSRLSVLQVPNSTSNVGVASMTAVGVLEGEKWLAEYSSRTWYVLLHSAGGKRLHCLHLLLIISPD